MVSLLLSARSAGGIPISLWSSTNEPAVYLITGAGGGVGSVSRRVVELLLRDGESVRDFVRSDDERATQLREMGADVFVGDLTDAGDVATAIDGASACSST